LTPERAPHSWQHPVCAVPSRSAAIRRLGWERRVAFLPFSPASRRRPGQSLGLWNAAAVVAAPGTPGFADDYTNGKLVCACVTSGCRGRCDLCAMGCCRAARVAGRGEIPDPRGWYDSATVVVGERAGWKGFSSSLVGTAQFAEPPRSGKPRAAVHAGDRLPRARPQRDYARSGATATTGCRWRARGDSRGTGPDRLRGQQGWFIEGATPREGVDVHRTSRERGANTTRSDSRFGTVLFPAAVRRQRGGAHARVARWVGLGAWRAQAVGQSSAAHGTSRVVRIPAITDVFTSFRE